MEEGVGYCVLVSTLFWVYRCIGVVMREGLSNGREGGGEKNEREDMG